MNIPLAERLRPKTLKEFVGQSHLIGKNGIINLILKAGNIPSLIFWGPPGTGKTTLANLIANEQKRPFYKLSAINAGVAEVRKVIEKSQKNPELFSSKGPILFIDEIHRFSKSQQDSLLGAVEKGEITLIGATTENPSFEIINALLSRCQIYILNPLSKTDLNLILNNAIGKDSFLKKKKIILKEKEALLRLSNGDGRKLLSIFELLINSIKNNKIEITNKLVFSCVQNKTVLYDKNGDQHFNIISAFIKSIRGSDPNGSIYWLARLINGGEDIKFIARRLIILASEDIGNANPTALVMANNTFQAINVVGLPESRIILSQCVIYLANSPKSNSAYKAINKAQKKIEETGDLEIPINLRNPSSKLLKDLKYGKDYKYVHNSKNSFIKQEYMPEEIKNSKFYEPGNNIKENVFRNYLKNIWGEKYNY
tara:strand:+ start:900 stop:2177 length:1278 start_codon:yes stop_codon:yes gene_type:complete